MSESKRIAPGVVLFLLVVVVSLGGWFLHFVTTAASGEKTESVTVVITKGTTLQGINEKLAEYGLVAEDIRFLFLARYLGVATKLQAGEFALHRGQTPTELLQELASAKSIQHPVTIPEGLVIDEIAEIFAADGWCDKDEFNRLARDPEFLKSLQLEQYPSLEGYLYPDTYYLTREGYSAADLIRMQVRRFFSVWDEVAKEKNSELSSFEILTLASMVEKEAGNAEERPVIAGVFMNRLARGMRFQSDPTVMYGIENFSGHLSKTDLRTPTPYNTYTVERFPAGPICNPGKDSIYGVLHPEKTDYLYFVSKGNGQHYFSKNLREHNRAVYKYLRSSKKRTYLRSSQKKKKME
jgi:UPF0755 protein